MVISRHPPRSAPSLITHGGRSANPAPLLPRGRMHTVRVVAFRCVCIYSNVCHHETGDNPARHPGSSASVALVLPAFDGPSLLPVQWRCCHCVEARSRSGGGLASLPRKHLAQPRQFRQRMCVLGLAWARARSPLSACATADVSAAVASARSRAFLASRSCRATRGDPVGAHRRSRARRPCAGGRRVRVRPRQPTCEDVRVQFGLTRAGSEFGTSHDRTSRNPLRALRALRALLCESPGALVPGLRAWVSIR